MRTDQWVQRADNPWAKAGTSESGELDAEWMSDAVLQCRYDWVIVRRETSYEKARCDNKSRGVLPRAAGALLDGSSDIGETASATNLLA